MTNIRSQLERPRAWLERYFPCPFERGNPVLVTVGIVSALVYVYTRIAFKNDMQDLPQNLMVLSFFISAWGQRHKLKSDLMFGLLVLAILIPWLLFAVNALIDYESAVRYRSVNDLVKLMLFLPLAWWVGGSLAGATRMLTIAFLGLMTAVAMDPNLVESLKHLWAGRRVDFAIHNAQHGAMFFGLVIIYCICYLNRQFRDGMVFERANALPLLACLVGLVGLIGTQTRAAFLGMFACGFVALVQLARQGNLFGQGRLSTANRVVVLVLVAGLLVWSTKEVLHDRMVYDRTIVQTLLDGKFEELPVKGMGIRLHFWAESLAWIAERPVTGWGFKVRSDVILLGERFPDLIKEEGFRHLHNGYLELLLGFGAVGFVFVCVLWGSLLRRIRRAAADDLYAFAFYSSVFFLVLNLFESFFFYWSGEFAVALFMAAGYSQYLARRLSDSLPENSAAGAPA